MTFPERSSLLELFQRTISNGVLQYFEQPHGTQTKSGIYSAKVVLWLMMLQRLDRRGTLACAVQLLIQGAADPLLSDCRRIRLGRISCRTGGYCQARQKFPILLCRQVTEELIERLGQVLNAGSGQTTNVYVLDGSSLELEHSPTLLKHYPPACNQHGQSHWPVLRLVVLHDVGSGLARQPHWGPMFGPQAVSEQGLAEQAIAALPLHSIVIGDRNFGIFAMAYAAQQRNVAAVLRLTDVRARKLAGGPISQPGEYRVNWQASRWDGRGQPCWPTEASVPGRLIAARVGRGKSQQWLYLFTTLERPAEELVELYGRRWNIETDLRSLKRTVRLHHINAKTVDMMEKELLVAVSAYNMVRAVICLAAQRSRIDPRQLSFSLVLNVVEAAWSKLITAPSKEQHDREFFKVLDLAAQCTLPKRTKARSFPRKQWRRGGPLQFRKEEN